MTEGPPRPEPPFYYRYWGSPLKIVRTSEGGLRAYLFNRFTGRFRVCNSAIREILPGPSRASADEIDDYDYDDFVLATEGDRAFNLRGDGPIFTIYQLRKAIAEAIPVLDEPAKQAIRSAIPPLYRQTYRMWKDEFARRDAGEPPSFHYEPLAGPDAEKLWITPDPTPDVSPEHAQHLLRRY